MRTSSHFLLLSLTSLLLTLVAGCGVRTALEIHADGGDGGARPDGSGPRDMGVPPDLGTCTSDAQCNDGLICDGTESCVAGRCQRGPMPSCDDGVLCTIDACSESGGCTFSPNDSACPPGTRCVPEAGGCVPNTMRCNSDAECDDRMACNGIEHCDFSTGACVAGPPMDCFDGVSCTDDACIEGFGCAHSANSAECPPDQICDPMIGCQVRRCDATGNCNDGDPCNGTEFCSSDGVCHPGSPLRCDDGNACTADFCITGIGCRSSTMPEVCGDLRDNDCNMLVDCMDPVCFGTPGCGGCRPTAPFEQFCLDGRDDDCNGLFDCMDPACLGRPECGGCTPTSMFESSCFDGQDNDCDGFFDCSDMECVGQPGCGPTDGGVCVFPENCHNGIDDDCNGPADCMDPFCRMTDPSCGGCMPTSPFERFCTDGRDDDCDGRIDCADRDCRGRSGCVDAGPTDSGIIFVDAGGPTMNELGVAACTNGVDDDRDGRIDCNDPDCRPFGAMSECCNGIDDTGDGNVDEFTCRCFDNSFCPSVGNLDQVCWSSSYSVCAPRCNFLGGTTWCQMLLPGTTCNFTTGECI